MEETVGPVSTCGRELLWGWWWPIGIMVSFMIFTASVQNILDSTLYISCYRIVLNTLLTAGQQQNSVPVFTLSSGD
jgi:hypothetical protein